MTSKTQLLNTLDSLVNQRVTVPTNPYGGQCAALIDYVLQYAGLFNLDFSYMNAIDGLNRAENLGLKVTRFNGSNNPPVGSVWVTNCLPYHQFGHIGFVVAENPDGTVTTVEQNIDGNGELSIMAVGLVRSLEILIALVISVILTGQHQLNKWLVV